VVTIIGWAFSREPKRIAVNPTTVLMGLFVLGITMNMPFAISPWPAEYEGWLVVLKMFVFFIITASLLTDRRRIDALIWVIVVSMGYWILDQGGASVVTLGGHKAYGPPTTMISDNNAFAVALLVVMPLINYLRMQASHKVARIGLLLVLGLTFLAVLASYSRGAFLGIVAVTLVLWWRSRSKLAGVIVLGAVLSAAILFMPPDWVARMHTIDHYQADGSAESRLYIWHVAWLLALHHPLTGVGFHGTVYQSVINTVVPGGRRLEIHSIWFQALGEQGFLVFFIWLGITIVGYLNTRWIIRVTRHRTDLAWAQDLARMGQVSIVAYATGGTFLPIAYWDIYFTVLVAVAATRVLVARAVKADATDRSRAWRTRMAGAIAAPAGVAAGVRGAVGRTVFR
jgi:probable O-glycosylation ligase (exosortase A-associated)